MMEDTNKVNDNSYEESDYEREISNANEINLIRGEILATRKALEDISKSEISSLHNHHKVSQRLDRLEKNIELIANASNLNINSSTENANKEDKENEQGSPEAITSIDRTKSLEELFEKLQGVGQPQQNMQQEQPQQPQQPQMI